MRSLLVLAGMLSFATPAAAQSIFPNGGAVQHGPTLWISASRMPAIEVTDRNGPVVFEIDEMRLEHGLRRIALRPQVADGPFTVTLDGKRYAFEMDAGLGRGDQVFHDVEFRRVAIERVRGRDTLVVDAIAEPTTILYFLNHSSPPNSQRVLARYVWSGPGKTIEPGRDGRNGVQRFELPLAELRVSCGHTANLQISPHTSNLSGSTILGPVAKLAFANGKVKLPVEMLAELDSDAEWLDCVGASVVKRRRVVPHGILSSLDTINGDITSGLDDTALYAGLLGSESMWPALPPPPILVEPGPDQPAPALPWSPLFAVLIALVIGHATTRLGS